MLASPLIIIGADKGGVGKTTMARLLVDFLQTAERGVRVFDTQNPRGALKRFYPDLARIIDICDVGHQADLVESLAADDAVTIVDVKAGQFIRTLRFMADVGLPEAAARGEARVLVLHLVGGSIASLAELDEVASYVGGYGYHVVRNCADDLFEESLRLRGRYLRERAAKREIFVPRLDSLAYEAVELAGLPFSSFIFGEPARGGEPRPRSFVQRGYVRSWLERSWTNIEEAGVRRFVAPLRCTA